MSSEILYLSNARLSFPKFVEPQISINEHTGKQRISYNGDFILEPNDPGYLKFLQRYSTLALDAWKERANSIMTMIDKDRKKRCYGKDEDKKHQTTGQIHGGYHGKVYITAGRDKPPQVIRPDGTAIDPSNQIEYQQLTRKMYAGCRVNAAIKPWLQDNPYGKGIRCDLIAIQFAGDDEPFGGEAKEPDVSGIFGTVNAAPTNSVGAAPPFAMPPAPFAQPSSGNPGIPAFLMSQ